MKQKIEDLMQQRNMTFQDLASHFTFSKQTLTKKLNGTLEWTFPEIMTLAKVFEIEDVQDFHRRIST